MPFKSYTIFCVAKLADAKQVEAVANYNYRERGVVSGGKQAPHSGPELLNPATRDYRELAQKRSDENGTTL